MPRHPDRVARAQLMAHVSPAYSPWLHLLGPAACGLAVITTALLLLEEPSLWEWLIVPATCVVANAAEWRIHKSVLHRRLAVAKFLYTRHTVEHHRVFDTEHMQVSGPREWRLVLLPGYAILLLIMVVVLPVVVAAALGAANGGLLFGATAVTYVLIYEWLHLAYHLPHDRGLGRLRIIRALGRHHALHHDPRLMGKYNFNVTLPLWDWVRGTVANEGRRAPRTSHVQPVEL